MKKILISALVVAMCAGISAAAFAATPAQQPPAFSDIAGHEAECALTLLGSLGIYTGDSGLGGLAKPDDPITRAQFCKVVVTAMGRATTAAGLAGLQPTFTDGATIPTWAWGYVNVAVYMGIINGYADGSFGPSNPVTYAEAVTMLIRAVPGHLAQVTPGIWPYNFLFYGVDEGFTGDECFGLVDVGFANLPATRGDIALMTVATMLKEKLDKNGVEIGGAQLVLFDGVVEGYTATQVDFVTTGLTDLALKYWICGAANLEGLRNLPVCYTYNAITDVYYLCVCTETNVVTGVFDKLSDADKDTFMDTIVLGDGTKVPYVDGGHVSTTWNQKDGHDETALAKGDDVVITLGDDGLAVNIQATHFEVVDWIVVFTKSVGGATPVDTAIDTCNTVGYNIPKTCRVTLNGGPSDRDLLAVDDVIFTAFSDVDAKPFAIKANRLAVEGTVTGTTTTWPGGVIRISIDLVGGGSKTYILNETGGIIVPGKDDKVKYGLDFDGAVYVPIGFETLTPYVVCLTYTVTGSGARTAVFDVRGVEVTYKVVDDFSGYIGDYLFVEVNTGTGTIETGDERQIVPDESWKVVAVDAVNGTMTLSDNAVPANYLFIDNPDLVVYDEDQVYVGLAGVSVGDWVLYDTTPLVDDPVFELTVAP